MTLVNLSSDAAGFVPAASFLQGGRICVSMFEDFNLNLIPDSGETRILGGVFRLGESRFEISGSTGLTCVDNVQSGIVHMQSTAPDGYRLLTTEHLQVKVAPGREVRVSFALIRDFSSPIATKFEDAMEPSGHDSTSIVIAQSELPLTWNHAAFAVLVTAVAIALGGLTIRRLRR